MSERRTVKTRHAMSGFFVFCLLGLFALLSAVLVMVGIRACQGVQAAADANSEEQIALSYVLNKVRAHDVTDSISLWNTDGRQVLCLKENLDGEWYETRIFCSDGKLCEYFCEVGEPFDRSMGEALTAAQALHLKAETPKLLYVQVTRVGGETLAAHAALRAGEVIEHEK